MDTALSLRSAGQPCGVLRNTHTDTRLKANDHHITAARQNLFVPCHVDRGFPKVARVHQVQQEGHGPTTSTTKPLGSAIRMQTA